MRISSVCRVSQEWNRCFLKRIGSNDLVGVTCYLAPKRSKKQVAVDLSLRGNRDANINCDNARWFHHGLDVIIAG